MPDVNIMYHEYQKKIMAFYFLNIYRILTFRLSIYTHLQRAIIRWPYIGSKLCHNSFLEIRFKLIRLYLKYFAIHFKGYANLFVSWMLFDYLLFISPLVLVVICNVLYCIIESTVDSSWMHRKRWLMMTSLSDQRHVTYWRKFMVWQRQSN